MSFLVIKGEFMDFGDLFDAGCKLTGFAIKTGVNVAESTIKGTISTAKLAGRACENIMDGDWEGLGDTAAAGAKGVFNCACEKVSALGEIGSSTFEAIEKGSLDPLLSDKNSKAVASIVTVGMAATGASLVNNLITSDDLNFDEIEIEKGMLVSNDYNLEELIEKGEIEGTTHIDSDDYSRDLGARDAFLQAHGYNGVPEGYEVHHIVPLCEGGLDSPSNMVLVSVEDHDKITAAHAEFYGWRS